MAFWVHFACRELLLKHLNFREEGDTSEWFKHELWNAMFGKPSSKHTVEGRTLSNRHQKKGVSKYQWVALDICMSSSVLFTGCYLRIHVFFSTAMFYQRDVPSMRHHYACFFWLEGGCFYQPVKAWWSVFVFFSCPEILGKKNGELLYDQTILKFLIFGTI